MAGWRLELTYAELPALLHSRVTPTPVRAPELVVLNRPLAESLGLDADALDGEEGAATFAGNDLPDGAQPLAQAYAGHQFGHFTGLGDGRAILLGEQVTPSGARVDIQLKGAGRTPYSRRGDGRAALGPMLREFVISEAMHALGIPTTRSLAVAATGEPVYRERVLPGAVLTRVAASHIRVGTFEWAAAHKDVPALQALAAYTRRRHYPDLPDDARAAALFAAIAERQARLVAQWQSVGFIHGVMNTDNMALSGETIDYGPCAFMNGYDPSTVFSSIDQQGRYAYGNQPAIARWNLARLAEAMLPLFDDDQARAIEIATAALGEFESRFEQHWLTAMRGKLGLFRAEADDATLIGDLLAWMQAQRADFTSTFADLANGRRPSSADATFDAWHQRWRARRAQQAQEAQAETALMQRSSPAVIPRNHLVEEALRAATHEGNLSPLEELLDALDKPFDHARERGRYAEPGPEDRAYRTFCGT